MGERRHRVGHEPAGRRATHARSRRQDHAAGLLVHQGEARGASHGVTTSIERRTGGYADLDGHRTWFADSGGVGEPIAVRSRRREWPQYVHEKPDLVIRLSGDFLNAPGKPETHMPVRRRAPK